MTGTGRALTVAALLTASVTWSLQARSATETRATASASAATTASEATYLLLDAVTGRVLDAHWSDPDRPRPVGSLIKPFTALAYGDTHRFEYPTVVCHGATDGCWLPAGHGRVGMVDAIAGSCNAYFRQLAQLASPETLAATLRWFGLRTDEAIVTPVAMVGFGDSVKLAPSALMRAYLELVARRNQPGVAPIVQGMRLSARSGTGRAVGAAIGRVDALVKTGTAPCSHGQIDRVSPSNGDGYTLVIYPADRPRVVLLVQAHGHSGAETAAIAGALLVNSPASPMGR